MSGVIHRYELRDMSNDFALPKDAAVISAAWWKGAICAWVHLPDTESPKEERVLHVYGTGWPINDMPGQFIDTVLIPEKGLVFHIYEERMS